MATQNTNTNYRNYMSADLGSGAKTTTGGTYVNPRLGIQDYTAFSRGVGSSLIIPQEEQDDTELLVDDPGAWDVEKNGFFIGKDGIYHDLDRDAFTIANNNFFGEGGEVEKGKADWKKNKRNKKKRNEISTYFSGYADLNNMGEALDMTEDSANDSNISVYFPDVNGDKTNISMADLARITKSNPNSLKITTKYNRSGIPQKGYLLNTGEGEVFLNATAMDAEWRKNNFAVKFNRNNVLNTARDNYRKNYQTDFYQENDTYTDPNNKTRTIKESDKYVQNKSIAQHNEHAIRFANDTFNEDSYLSSTFQSSWYQLSKAVGNGEFSFNGRNVEDSKALVNNLNNNGNNSDKLKLLKDYYTEQYKLQNASEAYVISENDIREDGVGFGMGRAIPKTIENEQFWDKDIARSEKTQTGTNINVNVGGDSGEIQFDPNMFENQPGFIGNEGRFNVVTADMGKGAYSKSNAPYTPKVIDLNNDDTFEAIANNIRNITGFQEGQLYRTADFKERYISKFLADDAWNTGKAASFDELSEEKQIDLNNKFKALELDTEMVFVENLNANERPIKITDYNLRSGSFLFKDQVNFYKQFKGSTTADMKWKKNINEFYTKRRVDIKGKEIPGTSLKDHDDQLEFYANLKNPKLSKDDKLVQAFTDDNGVVDEAALKDYLVTINAMRATKKYTGEGELEYIPVYEPK